MVPFHLRMPIAVLLCACLLAASAAAQVSRATREVRTINTDVYEVSIQQNGRVNLRFTTLEPIFEAARPMVRIAGENAPRPLPIDGRQTGRFEVNDRLGRGQGMRFIRGACEWTVRAYPAKPFLTVSVAYVNETRRPVHVSGLIPWSTAGPSPGALRMGPEASATQWLDQGAFVPDGRLFAEVRSMAAKGEGSLAGHNPVSGRSLIAGFLTNVRGHGVVETARSDDAPGDAFPFFQAECIYDPPVEVPPGARLESELFYISVGETDPLLGLERFAKAFAVVNGVRDSRPFLPHGWDSWSSRLGADISEAALLRELDAAARDLKPHGWRHFTVGAGWQRALGDWEPDPDRFPNGMRSLVEAIHARGMTAGLWLDPFSAALDSRIAQDHPEWLLEPGDAAPGLRDAGVRILDVTRPEVREHVHGIVTKIRRDWGFDAIMPADQTHRLLVAEGFADAAMTRTEILHMGMRVVESAADGAFLMGVAPQHLTGVHAHGVHTGVDTAPRWHGESGAGPWGAADALANAARRFYFAPHVHVPNPGPAYFAHDATRARWNLADQPALTRAEQMAWFTGAALSGGVVQFAELPSELDAAEIGVLRRLLPAPPMPARPLDLFQEGAPQVWSLPMRSAAGEWHIAGVFNWDAASSDSVSLPFDALGLDASRLYTVFDFWEQRFHGLARARLEVELPPGGMRLLGLRPFHNRPAFLASDRHILQGAMHVQRLDWDAEALALHGALPGLPGALETCWLYVPEPYQLAELHVDGKPAEGLRRDGNVVRFTLPPDGQDKREWIARFTRE